ncbi:MAG: hypothetical protein EOP51_28360, partial [Sphingobacteriales bacterium]
MSNPVYLNTIIAVQPVSVETCLGTATSIDVIANGLSLTHQWYRNTSNNNTNGILIDGATQANYSPPVTAIGTIYYYDVIVNNGQGCAGATTNAVAVTVSAVSNAGTVSANRTICSGSTTSVSISNYTGNTITWQQSTDGTTWASVTGGSGASSATYTTPAITVLTFYRALVSNGSCAAATSGTITIIPTTTNFWEGDVSNDWNTAGNWACGTVPTLTTDVQIPVVTAPNVYPVITGATGGGVADARNVNIVSGASITVSNNGLGVFRVAGGIVNNGTLDAINGTVAFLGTTAQSIPANTFHTNFIRNLTIDNAAGVTLAGNLNLTGILTAKAGQFTTGDQLVLKSNVATTAMVAPVTGSVSGTMTIERYIPARRAFRMISSPVNGGSIFNNWQEGAPQGDIPGFGTDITGVGAGLNGFDASLSNNPSLFTYDNVGGTSWVAVTSTLTNNLMAGKPWRMLVRGDRTINQESNYATPTITTLRSRGTIATGDVTFTNLSQTGGRSNFIGNPYQAPVDMEAVLNGSTNVNKGYYFFWDPTLGGTPVVGQDGGRGA